jgi:hypothetical protein
MCNVNEVRNNRPHSSIHYITVWIREPTTAFDRYKLFSGGILPLVYLSSSSLYCNVCAPPEEDLEMIETRIGHP